MSDKVFALLTVTVSGLFSVSVVILSEWLRKSHEIQTLRRETRRDEVKATRELYEEASFILEMSCRRLGWGTAEYEEIVAKFLAKMHLLATPEIREQYFKTSDAVQTYLASARQASPEQMGTFLIISSAQSVHRAKANELWPNAESALENLRKLMRNHLESMERAY